MKMRKVWRGWMLRLLGCGLVIFDEVVEHEEMEDDIELPTPIIFSAWVILFPVLLLLMLLEWLPKKMFSRFPNIADSFVYLLIDIHDELKIKFDKKWFWTKVERMDEEDRMNYYKYMKILYRKPLIGSKYDQEIKNKIEEEYKKAYEEHLILKIAGIK